MEIPVEPIQTRAFKYPRKRMEMPMNSNRIALLACSRSLSGIDSAEAPNMTAFPEGVWA